jgi:phosphoribosylanthranilate isomerase
MPLKTVVKVGNISNLSDARYCAGMGVNMLGFRVLEGQENFISPKLFQEIRGWVSGPKVVAEIYGIESPEQLPAIVSNYAPDYFELSLPAYRKFHQYLILPSLVFITLEEAKQTILPAENIAYIIVSDNSMLEARGKRLPHPVLLKTDNTANLPKTIQNPAIAGLALSGTPELRPGFKDYQELADILEQLDED